VSQVVPIFGADSYVDDANPDTNYGAEDFWYIRQNNSDSKNLKHQYAFAYADLSGIGITAAEVDSAYIKAYCYAQDGYDVATIVWHRVISAWDEATITWNNKPDYDEAVVSSTLQPFILGWHTWTATDMIKDALANRSGIWTARGWMPSTQPSIDNFDYYYSSEYAAVPAYRPYLEINYTTGGVEFVARVMII
jgi:hypothetical protein